MLAEQWQLGLLAVVLVGHALVAYRVYRFQHRSGGTVPGVRSAEQYVDHGSGTVECPACGSENDLGYRYCRRCVGDLPAAAGPGQSPRHPLRQVT